MKISSSILLALTASALLLQNGATAKDGAANKATEDTLATSAQETKHQEDLLQKVKELAAHGVLVETFEEEELFDGKRWFKSSHEKYTNQEVSVDEYTVRTGHVSPDKGLVLDAPAKHYGLAVKLDKPLHIDGSEQNKELVVQYEVKLQKGLNCGGAYVKLLRANESTDFKTFSDDTPFVIMFGPDKCGSSDKVHFIFQHKSPVTGKYEEKHMMSPPQIKSDRLSHIYTAVMRDDNTYEIFIDQKSVSKGSLLENFVPSVIPDKEIDDPNDTKPGDWADESKIRDPNAVKPDDWDEDAPARIPDTDAVKPADWLDDEPALIDDPSVVKPEDWDDEDDGEWVTPQIPNPKCENAVGCGEWQRPTKANPAFKGKWYAPLIPNPAYKGEWEPRKIPNPDYFEDAHPARLDPIGALAVEVWTMSDGITFDNFWLGNDLKKAQEFAEVTWVPKHNLEIEEQEKAREKEKQERQAKESGFLNSIETMFMDFLAFAQANPVVGIGSALAVGFVTILAAFFLCCGKSDEIAVEQKEKDSGSEEDVVSEDDKKASDKKQAAESSADEGTQKVRQRKKKAPIAN
uniref:Calnexin n=1 Tax=Globisporangium ultimum (strain ATCC 200006 / CBS 805.95 / DAOM BR144) TaxID=431595 RepID=K3XC77_GLOUD